MVNRVSSRYICIYNGVRLKRAAKLFNVIGLTIEYGMQKCITGVLLPIPVQRILFFSKHF